MNYPYHIILGFLFSLGIFFLFPSIGLIGFFIIFLSSILIDLDHQLYYVYKKRTLNPFKIHKYMIDKRKRFLKIPIKKSRNYYSGIFILHGIEIIFILYLLSFISIYFLYVLIGFSFHLFLDFLFGLFITKRINRISLIWSFLKNKKLKYFE